MTLSEAEKQYKAGKIKILVVSAPKRLDRLPEIPTWKEQGINVIFQHWKGIMGPKDMTEEEVAYWDGVIKRMVESDSWKGILRERGWNSYYKDSGESKIFWRRVMVGMGGWLSLVINACLFVRNRICDINNATL